MIWDEAGILSRVFVCCAALAGIAPHANADGYPMTFKWGAGLDGMPAIFADGEITPDTSNALLAFVERSERVSGSHIFLNSGGGDLQAGIDLGRLIRRLQLDTRVGSVIATGETQTNVTDAARPADGRCVSACALAFLGGVRRHVDAGSTYAVHQLQMTCTDGRRSRERYPWLPMPGAAYCPEVDDAIASVQAANGVLVEYISEMGADPMYLKEMSLAESDRLNVIDQEQMKAFGIITESELQN